MDYNKLVKEINKLENEDLTIENFKFAGRIKKELYHLFMQEIIEKRVGALHDYESIKELLEKVMYQKLKEKLAFEDEVINQIMYFLDYASRLEDIYVLDGIVMVKVTSLAYNKRESVTYLAPQSGFNEMKSIHFNNTFNVSLKTLLIGGLNHVLNPLFKDYLNGEDALFLDGESILYNLPNLEVYFDRSLKEITNLKDNEVVKILVKYGSEEIYSFDMKLRDGFLVIASNDYQLKKLSTLLDSKQLVKKM